MPQLTVTSALTGEELFGASYDELGGSLVPSEALRLQVTLEAKSLSWLTCLVQFWAG